MSDLRDQAIQFTVLGGKKIIAKVYYDGTFEVDGVVTKDKEALAEALIEWTIEYGKSSYNWVMPKKKPCDCGAEKANTTHSSWCSSFSSS